MWCMWEEIIIFGQVALEAAYTHGDEWLDQLIVYLEKNYQLLEASTWKRPCS